MKIVRRQGTLRDLFHPLDLRSPDTHVPFGSRGEPREFLRRVFEIAGVLVLVMLGMALLYDLIALAQGNGRSRSVAGHWTSTNAIGAPSASARSDAGFKHALSTVARPATLNGMVIRAHPHACGVVPRTASMLVCAPTVDANGVKSFPVASVFQGSKPTTVRVLEPSRPAPGKPRRSLYVLPVESGVTGLYSTYSDGLEELRRLDVHNRYNLTLIAPSFHIEPWYGDHLDKIDLRLESFIVKDLVPFGDSFAAPNRTPQRWLIGFSKSGTGALSLILRHPNVFTAVAAWDGPAQFTDMSAFRGMKENFGTEENFNRYEIPALVMANAAAFRARNRIWISGDDSAWTSHMVRLSEQMVQVGVLHTFVRSGARRHHWASGWLEDAVAWLDASAAPDASGRFGTPDRLPAASTRIWVGDIGWTTKNGSRVVNATNRDHTR